ncbi:MAG: hypothetical protein Q9220_007656 [cf. Caloplaca sp. 1 TL-2023]
MPRQNGYDCGVHVLIAALCSITKTAPPMEVPSLPWRRILSRFLVPITKAENPRQQEQDFAPPSLQVLGSRIKDIEQENDAIVLREGQRLPPMVGNLNVKESLRRTSVPKAFVI